MRVVFMGSPEFAVPTLEALVEDGHDVLAVYAQPPRPAGRGKADRRTAVHQRADELGLPVRVPKSLRTPEDQQEFAALGAEIGVVAAYGLILPLAILQAPSRGCINVHASLLPRWRGAAPVQRAMLAGDLTTGITLMQMDVGLDTGAMLTRSVVDIGRKTAGQLISELANVGATLVRDYLREPDLFPASPQPQSGVTYAHKIEKREAALDFTLTAEELERRVRAFNPVPGAWFEIGGERIKVLEATIVPANAPPGTVMDERLTIACSDQGLRPQILQRAGKSRMQVDEFTRGFPIAVGLRVDPVRLDAT